MQDIGITSSCSEGQLISLPKKKDDFECFRSRIVGPSSGWWRYNLSSRIP